MKLLLKRIAYKPTYTIGKLSIDGNYFCDTLERENRDLNKNGKFDNGETKVMGETCIPFGTYQVIVNRSPRMKRDLPRLLNVPNFDGVLIHRGNYPKDTKGCILIGENKEVGMLLNSTKYEIKLVQMMKLVLLSKGDITITII